MLFVIDNKVFSHECILKGDTATEINSYNTCKVDEINQSQNLSLKLRNSKKELDFLKEENFNLKQKLVEIKLMLQRILFKF